MAHLPANLTPGTVLQITENEPYSADLAAGDLVEVIGFFGATDDGGPSYAVESLQPGARRTSDNPLIVLICEDLGVPTGWVVDGNVARLVPADEIGA